MVKTKDEIMISIHALVKRATIYDKLTEMRAIISIHALVKRATAFITDVEYVNNISIHALVKRATVLNAIRNSASQFQSTPS